MIHKITFGVGASRRGEWIQELPGLEDDRERSSSHV